MRTTDASAQERFLSLFERYALAARDAGLVREKSEVKFTVGPVDGPTRTGTITRTSWSLDPGARTLRAEIDLPNKDESLRPGMYVYARITGHLPEAWTLPASALVKQGDVIVCFRIVDGKAARTPVQIGRSDGKFTEVLKVQTPGEPPAWAPPDWTGEEGVVQKAVGLSDGQEVRVERPEK